MNNLVKAVLVCVCGLGFVSGIYGQDGNGVVGLRGTTPLNEVAAAVEVGDEEVLNKTRPRQFPTMAPTIPHSAANFNIDLGSNQCLMCHNKDSASTVGAPAVAVSHYRNRDGEFLADISPRRYFCTQCHVSQRKSAPLQKSIFKAM